MTARGSTSKDQYLPPAGEPWTPIRLTRWSGAYLGERGIENGRLDAELILSRVLNVGRLDLYLQFERPITEEELREFKALLVRRAGREPLQYILGTTVFRELDLRTDARALIPRPETEVLVEEVLKWARSCEAVRRGEKLVGLDIGTGTGAVALSLLREGPFLALVATDPSREALALARENALSVGHAAAIDLRIGPLFEPIREDERFDVVVSNPPYVAVQDAESLEPEVREWEPAGALFAGPSGLDVLAPLIRGAPSVLRPGGLLALEIGEGQGEAVLGMMREAGSFRELHLRPDLAGRDRIALGVAAA